MTRATKTVGTARELGESPDVGYTASGEGQWSRNSASSGNIKMPGYAENPPGTSRKRGPRGHDELIAEQRGLLAKLRDKLKRENIPARYLKLQSSIAIKSAFVAKLENEKP